MPCNVPRDLEQRARYRSPALEDRRARMQANERKTFFLSHEDRIRHATVGLIPQEGRRQNRGAELFCRNLQRTREIEGERGREREIEKIVEEEERVGIHIFWNAGAQGPGERANSEGTGAKGRRGTEVGNRTESRRLEVGVVRGRR